ncbi:hypothetical protein R1flu_026738 [Riccia fluitans]|uniref:Secreted protein n=1 Tax=Riccia fluitans TaxID=41844 RepID=A0ABD1XGS2_9MARC
MTPICYFARVLRASYAHFAGLALLLLVSVIGFRFQRCSCSDVLPRWRPLAYHLAFAVPFDLAVRLSRLPSTSVYASSLIHLSSRSVHVGSRFEPDPFPTAVHVYNAPPF